MKRHPNNHVFGAERASALILVLAVSAAIAVMVASMLSLSSQAWRNSDRMQYVTEAMLVAQSELDCMFCDWGNFMVLRNPIKDPLEEVRDDHPAYWTPVGGSGQSSWEEVHPPIAEMSPGLPWRVPTLAAHAQDWRVIRSLELVQFGVNDDGDPIYEMNACVGGTDFGKVRYFVARVTVTPVASGEGGAWSSSSIRGGAPIYVQMGRRFSNGNLSPFTNLGSYTGRMELSPGGTTTIDGDISANGDVYLGTTGALNIMGKVRMGNMVNDTPDGDTGFNPSAGYDPDQNGVAGYNPDGDGKTNYDNYYGVEQVGPQKSNPEWNYGDAYASDDEARRDKVERLTRPKEITGLNPQRLFEKYGPDHGPGDPRLFDTLNDARRLVASPPNPNDPPEVAPYRMYNRAGIRITINGAGPPAIVSVDPATGNTTPLPDLQAAIVGTPRKDVYDRREDRVVQMTTIDIAKLTAEINAEPSLKAQFNGVLYVHDLGASAGESNPNGGIRLINGQTTPGADSFGQEDGTGFTVATDSPLYIQGDFNTTENANGKVNRVSLIADAVTALSGAWDDANSSPDKPLGPVEDPENAANNHPGRIASNPTGADPTVTTVNAGILTGNTPTNQSGTQFSGGLQNLVRYLEDWTGKKFEYSGSLGQIFESKYQTSQLSMASFGDVYYNPTYRTLVFDKELAGRPPKGSLETPIFTSGDLFTFTR